MSKKQAYLVRIWDIFRTLLLILPCVLLLARTSFTPIDNLPLSYLLLAIYGFLWILNMVGERWMRRNIPEAENRPYPKWVQVISFLILILVFYDIMKG